MAGKKRKNWVALGALVFFAYVFMASTPIGKETVLVPAWLSPVESEKTHSKTDPGSSPAPMPFKLGSRFGYYGADSGFSLIETVESRLSLNEHSWASYGASPDSIEVMNVDGSLRFVTNERGYPLFIEDQTWIIGPEQNTIALLGESGKILWCRQYPSPITCADAAVGLTLVGLLDGSIDLIATDGSRVFYFEPGGSRLPVITSAHLSSDARRIALVSGVDPQRFLLLERGGDAYKVIHHEYLGVGFRRPVISAFVGNNAFFVFESESGLGVHAIASKKTTFLPLNGRVLVLNDSPSEERFFLTVDSKTMRELVGVRLPATIFMRAPFLSAEPFLAVEGQRLYLGSPTALAALDISSK